ncbi:Meiotically up-regulated gene 66 protein [Wickerhamiella sorbophila]|uniref:Autophagy-related protein 101 n=1 Tax=Wickerhamiella sorbophila TaxID=45607 RepID=A0A2T0FCG4_9ASCO|nr:Meiotically up-regulated gene 66 protein [Wickerhamiella sorbophila]PRT52671.1 Meiotically up-regulated gene 66 protein [Wickerhamiella sorbophila]
MVTFVIELTSERASAGDAVKAVLCTIFFQRMFGSIEPSQGQANGVSYPFVDHAETMAILNERVRDFEVALRDQTRAVLTVQFQDHKVKKATWFAKTQDVSWEEWRVEVQLDPNADTTASLQRALFKVLQTAETQREHIPPITTRDIAPFPYEVLIDA